MLKCIKYMRSDIKKIYAAKLAGRVSMQRNKRGDEF